jgi:hypothetical protein
MVQALHEERLASRARFSEERRALTLAQRVERGLALRDLAIEDTEAAARVRALLWLVPCKSNIVTPPGGTSHPFVGHI